jgi:ComF family protein
MDLLVGGTRRFLDTLLEFLYPPLCLHCGDPTAGLRDHLCGPCARRLVLLSRDDPLLQEARVRTGGTAQVDDVITLYRFEEDSPVRTLIHALKYSGQSSVGIMLGELLGRSFPSLPPCSCLVPVPLHVRRERDRGYNQSMMICRGIGRVTGIPVQSILRRIRPTRSQTRLNREERRENVRDAFVLRRGRAVPRGMTVFLVDDVLTTGATLCEAARILKQGGAASVVVCTATLAEHSP